MTTWDEHGRPDDDDVDWLAIPVSGYPLPVRDTYALDEGSHGPTDVPTGDDTWKHVLDS